jgi:hypothetical protein
MSKFIHKDVRCKSGLMGEQYKLQNGYANFEEFDWYSNLYHVHTRLGYKTIKGCWKANPTIQSSVNPSDLRKVSKKELA